ncbi:MAG TPA: adenylate/guanylate cyclase domain-containing protein [Candidatus Limnocylindria bacterium]|nr:adenylate/guanylate cyclase domain-containing protein [Candidatus Limnocylindria bacterium]
MTEERKLVTVLFADIVGSTEIGLEHDPEVVRATLARTFEAVREVLVAHGGTVEKFIGDAVMAVFGVPAAHEDDADRAVRAAFALHERASALGGRLPLVVRTGVNTGEVVAGSGATALVTGTPVIAAGRLQTAAAPGEILVGALTHALTRDGVRYGTRRGVAAKGLGTLEAWPALALESALPEAHRGLGPLRAPLIGRDRELRLLEDAFARVSSEAAPALVTIFGPAGAGKSRLASEFVERVGRDRVRTGRSLPYGEGITFYPVQLMIREECWIEPADDRASALGKLARTAAAMFDDPADAQAIAARVAAAVGLAPAREALPDLADRGLAEELRYGIRRFFEHRATREPLALVFEDFQWAEPGLVELVEHLAEWSRAPILLLCLARPDFRDTHPHFGAEAANASTVTLAPLTPNDTRLLVAELLAIEALTESLRAEVVRRAEGNPLYVEEFLRLLIETGRIVQYQGRWEATGELERQEVPPTLVGLVSARLDRVSREVKQILQRASIVGRVVSTGGLEAISGAPVLPELLREAVRRDLLAEADERALGAGRVYRFKHLLTRDVAYNTVPKTERVRLHDRYARWLEGTLGDRQEETADIIAFHAEQSFRFAKELGQPEGADLGARALDLLLSAATFARRRGADSGASRLYERAAAVAGDFPSSFPQRAEAIGFAAFLHVRYRSERTPALEAELAKAITLAEELGPSELLFQLLSLAAQDNAKAGRSGEARELYDRLVPIAEATGDVAVVAEAMVSRGVGSYFLGDYRQWRTALEAAHKYMLIQGTKRGLVRCLANLATAAGRDGEFTSAHRYAQKMEQATGTRSKHEQGIAAQALSVLAFSVGKFDEASHWAQEEQRFGVEGALPSLAALGRVHLCGALLESGRFAEAREVVVPAAELFEKRGDEARIPEARARLALACVGLGDLPGARESLARARESLQPKDHEAAQITAAAGAALAEAEGRPDEAEHLYRETIVALDHFGAMRFDLAQTYVDFAAFLIRQRRLTQARDLLGKARAFYSDPLAARRREQIDALLAQCEVVAG